MNQILKSNLKDKKIFTFDGEAYRYMTWLEYCNMEGERLSKNRLRTVELRESDESCSLWVESHVPTLKSRLPVDIPQTRILRRYGLS